jgi:hypothetical protein
MRSAVRRPAWELLESRVLLSTSIPLSETNWTFMGPAPLDWGASSFGLVSGRILDIATHPGQPGTWYIATASGGVWKTVNAGSSWTPLTDSQPVNFMGSVALAPSNPDIVYAGTGEATWGPSKKALRRDNIYYGRGVLKSTDAGSTWTLLGNSEFHRRAIGKIVVDPTNPNTVYLAVGAQPQNGLPGNTGIWKSTNGGTTWTNTTTSISTTAAFSDVVMDPTSPNTLYAAVGDPDGDATNGLYKTINGGTSWSAVATFPNQNAATLGRITLALAPSSPQTVYAWSAASGQGGPGAGQDLAFSQSTNGGTSWTPRALPATGASLDYNMAMAVDPTNPNTLYVGGQGSGSPTSSTVKKSTNGGTNWTGIGIGQTQSVHPDHHAMAFTSDGFLLDGNDGGIWRLVNPNIGSIEWNSRNTNLGSIQFVGAALHPTDPDIAYAGAQDNGTSKFDDNLFWPVIRGGDGGITRVDPANSSTVYHTFYYSGPGFLERSDNNGVNWTGATSGINTTDPANFYPPYVIDPTNTARLLLGTNRVYQTLNRGTSWSPISTVNTGGWTTNAVIDAVATARTNGNTVYATAGGRVFVSTSNGASWTERNAPGALDHFSDIVVDPFDANVAYIARDRFDEGGHSGHVWRTTNAGVSWTNITSNLPDIPAYALELNAGLPQTSADDVIYVGTDAGVYATSNLGASWSVLASGLPSVQVHELDYNFRTGILAAGTHGRGLWQLSVPAPIGVWTGLGDAINWSNPANWSRNTIPGAANDAFIGLSTNPTVVVSDSRAVRSLYSDELISISGGGQLSMGATSRLASLSIASGGRANVLAGGDKLLLTRSLSLAGTGTLDLFDNDLIVDYTVASPLATVASLIRSARNGGDWDGAGITSTPAANNATADTTLGAIESSDYQSVYGAGAPFAGEPTDSTMVLVKYTYYGDTDYNGLVDGDDYGRTDLGFNLQRSGWFNGDFDLDGDVDGDDYALIDLAFNTQTGPL